MQKQREESKDKMYSISTFPQPQPPGHMTGGTSQNKKDTRNSGERNS